jgi:hypothetical protein
MHRYYPDKREVSENSSDLGQISDAPTYDGRTKKIDCYVFSQGGV